MSECHFCCWLWDQHPFLYFLFLCFYFWKWSHKTRNPRANSLFLALIDIIKLFYLKVVDSHVPSDRMWVYVSLCTLSAKVSLQSSSAKWMGKKNNSSVDALNREDFHHFVGNVYLSPDFFLLKLPHVLCLLEFFLSCHFINITLKN